MSEASEPNVATESSWHTIRRGLALSPELRGGLAGTLALSVVAMLGRAAVPVAIQQGVDRGLRAVGGPDFAVVATVVAITTGVLVLAAGCSYLMMRRLFTVSEQALASLRQRTFRHVHDLSLLRQQEHRRGALTARVTSDVDQITQFLQWGGVILLVSVGQIVVTTVVMAIYSWQLTVIVYASFLPLVIVVRVYQRRLAAAYGQVRTRVAAMLAAVSESVVGAEVIRAYGVRQRTAQRLDDTIDHHRRAQFHALRTSVMSFSAGEVAAGLATAAVVVVGVRLGIDGAVTVGQLTAFLFLVAIFVQPVQISTEVLNEAQNAVAGWRRVLAVLDLPRDLADPPAGLQLPTGPLDARFDQVDFAYPDGPRVLHGIDLTVAAGSRVAVVGETGSGKSTFAKLLVRLIDPDHGSVRLAGIPVREVSFASLRRRVAMVPQDGFLFDATIAENVRLGGHGLSDEDVERAFVELGLGDWLDGLPAGVATPVGERGEALSVGQRQLVALARAYLSDPDLLVLDEATSAVDPATESRLRRAFDTITRGRTTVTVAHRLSTAETADEVIVFDQGRIVQRGPHAELVGQAGSVYARLHAAWLEQTRSAGDQAAELPSPTTEAAAATVSA